MKLTEIQEPSEWDNTDFENRKAEIAFLEKKIGAIKHLRSILYQKLSQMKDAGIIIENPAKGYEGIRGTGSKETGWHQWYGPVGDRKIEEISQQISATEPRINKHKERIKDLTVRGNTYCFTGFRDSALENRIYQLGGKVVSSVINNLDYLVTKTLDSDSAKMLKAKQTRAKVITRQELVNFLRD